MEIRSAIKVLGVCGADSPRGQQKPKRNLDWGTGNPGARRCRTQTPRTFQRAAAPPPHRTSGTSWSQLCAHPAGRDSNPVDKRPGRSECLGIARRAGRWRRGAAGIHEKPLTAGEFWLPGAGAVKSGYARPTVDDFRLIFAYDEA
jgi:hypothetical protein